MPDSVDTVMQILGLTLLHFLWQGLLLGIVFAVLMRMLRESSAQARYVCAVGALVVVFLTPFATSWWLFSQTIGSSAAAPAGFAAAALPGAASVTAIGAAGGGALAWSLELMPMVVCAWLAGVLLLTARMIMDARYVRWLKRSADTCVPFDLADAMERFCDQLELSRQRIGLGITPHVSTALVVGWLRPMVLLPAAVIGRLPLRQLELILAHELAHIRRHDPIVNLFQVVVETVLFYHPVVRLISRRIRIERENCTDDLVVQLSRDSMSYARALTALEELRGASIRLSIGAVDGDFARRIRRLFQPPRRQKGMLSAGIVSALTALLMVFANVAAWQLQQWRNSDSAPGESVEIAESAANENIAAELESARLVTGPGPEPIELAVAETPSVDTIASTNSDAVDVAESLPAEFDIPAPSGQQLEIQEVAANTAQDTIDFAQQVAEQTPAQVPEVAAEFAPDASQFPGAPGNTPEQLTANQPEIPGPVDFNPDTAMAYVPPASAVEEAGEPEPEPLLRGGRLIDMQPPKYPTRARLRGIETEVRLSFVIGADGRPRDIQLLDESDDTLGFGKAAQRAVEKWRFEPFTLDGETVEKRVEQILDFSLTGGELECGPVTGTRIGSRSGSC